MVGSGLKKLAAENGMRIGHGVAYGSLRGFVATMSEGAGWKRIVFAAQFPDPVKKTQFLDAVGEVDVNREFRVQSLDVGTIQIRVDFLDNPGTMKKVCAFLDWFIPLLQEYGANGAEICSECGFAVTGGKWALVNGVAYHFHDACAEKVRRDLEQEDQERREADNGSYLTGAVGAFGGALLGSVVWALVLLMGYVASIVGLLIGWLAEKGYTLLRGRQGKAKVLILIVAIVFGVVAGTLTSDVLTLVQMIKNREIMGAVMGDIPMLMGILLTDADYLAGTGKNVLMGLLFAALGVWGILRQAGADTADSKFVDLE